MSTPRPLPELRAQLDRLDRSLIAILAERLDVCREVARAKERTSAKIIQPTRVREIWNTRRAWAAEAHVDPSFAEQIFRTLLSETHRIESAEADGRRPIPAPAEIPYDSALQLAATRIDHVVIPVPDLAAAERFFVDALGFDVGARSSHRVALHAGAVTTILVEEEPTRTPQIALEVLDTEHARTDLEGRGARLGPTVVGVDGLEEFFIASDSAAGVRVAIVSRTGERTEADGSLLDDLATQPSGLEPAVGDPPSVTPIGDPHR